MSTAGGRLPYPGLRSFTREETDLFFGREGCVDDMVDRLAATRFLAVLGASGSGKSSLVKTGLLDALEIGLLHQAGSRWHDRRFPARRAARSTTWRKRCCGRRAADPRRRRRGRGEAPAHLPRARPSLRRGMVRGGQSAGRHEPASARRPVRGALPLRRLYRARGGGGLRRDAARKRRGAAVSKRASMSRSPCAPNISARRR